MRFETFIVHAGQGYLPDDPAISVRPITKDDLHLGYDYNEITENDDWLWDEPQDYGITVFEGELADLERAFGCFAVSCATIRGADDDHYDYWPSHFSGLIAFARFLDEQTDSNLHLEACRVLWDGVVWMYAKTDDEAKDYFSADIHPRP